MFCVERNSNTSIKNLRKVFPFFPNKMHISRPSNLTKYFYCTEIFIQKKFFLFMSETSKKKIYINQLFKHKT